MGLTWYSDVEKDDDDLLNASVEVDVSAIVLQLVHLKPCKVRDICKINFSPCACPEMRIAGKIIVHPVVDVDPMVLVGKVCFELVPRLFIRFCQPP